MPSRFEDWHAVNTLLMTYAEHLDSGRFAEFVALFEHATYRIEHSGHDQCLGVPRARRKCSGSASRRACTEDGTPRTKHVITNVNIQLDGDSATASSYATVFQQTDVLPLQPIASGRYLDRFSRVVDGWRFADRLITGFLLGDRSQHVVWYEGAPEGAGS